MAKGRFAGTIIRPIAERLAARIVIDENGCWNWTGATVKGYGVIRDSQRLGVGKSANVLTHRLSYELHRGPIGTQTLDHLCRNRRCCNPDHLEEVSIAENRRRARGNEEGKCIRGHVLRTLNSKTRPGRKACRECVNARRRVDS